MGVQSTGVSQSVRETSTVESQSVLFPEKLLKTRDFDLPTHFYGVSPKFLAALRGIRPYLKFLPPYFSVAKFQDYFRTFFRGKIISRLFAPTSFCESVALTTKKVIRTQKYKSGEKENSEQKRTNWETHPSSETHCPPYFTIVSERIAQLIPQIIFLLYFCGQELPN